MGGPLNPPAGEDAGGVAVDEQAKEQARRVLRVAGAAFVDPRSARVQLTDRIHDEVDKVIGRHPLAQVRRQQQRRVVINVDKAGSHTLSTHQPIKSSTECPTGC
jgi:predicted metal-dependent phosphoesterase TrpH